MLFLFMLFSYFVYALDRSPHRVPNIGDFNNDGKNDFVLNGLYMKHNDTLFYDMTSYSLGIENKTNVSYGFFFDYDGDGDLDIYLVFENEPNRIYKAVNPSDYDYDLLTGVNENVTGNSTSPLGANAYDLNNDGCTDLYANNRLFYSNCDGTFNDTSEQSNLDPDDLPRLKQVIFSDVNYDGLVDFIALSEDNQILLYLNQNDTNNDGIVEFWDASEVSRLKNWTESLDKINWIDAYWMHDGDLVPGFFSFGIYIARDGLDKLLISDERAPDLPYFEDYSDEANITQNYNTTCAYFYDFGNENFTDIFVSYDGINSSILMRNGTIYQYRYARFNVWNETWIFCFAGRLSPENIAGINNKKDVEITNVDASGSDRVEDEGTWYVSSPSNIPRDKKTIQNYSSTFPWGEIEYPTTCTWFNTTAINVTIHLYDDTSEWINYTICVDGNPEKSGQVHNCTPTNVTVNLPGEGHHNISICNATDEDGKTAENLDSVLIHVDTTPPTESTMEDPTTCTWFNTTIINVTIHAKDNLAENLTYNITVDGNTVATGNTTNCTPKKVQIDVGSEGHHNIRVIFKDQAGNTYTTDDVTIHVDTTPPSITEYDFPTCTWYNSSNITIKFHYYDNMAHGKERNMQSLC